MAFSGGLDSSLVLAVGTNLARREGLPLPAPVTFRFPEAPQTDEGPWQELVIKEVGVSDWIKVGVTDELDYLGPLAQRVLHRHGVFYPPNAYFWIPLLARARGGVLLTGVGGDDVFESWLWRRHASLLVGRGLSGPRDALRIANLLGPRRLRRALLARNIGPLPPWLTPAARRELIETRTSHDLSVPRRWREHTRWLSGARYVRLQTQTFDAIAKDAGSSMVQPLLDRRFLAAVGHAGGLVGWPNRHAALEALFPGLLPAELLARTTKAGFGEAYWGPEMRTFVSQWTGEGVDARLVDEEALRAVWSRPEPDYDSVWLAQSAWLALNPP